MKHNALAIALVTAATTLPATSHAAEDVCSRLFIYAVNQLCQLLPNGQSLCQPVGLAGPSPSCESPSTAAMVQIPLGPPVIQMPQLPSFAAGSNPFVPPAFQPAFPANPYGGAPYSGAPYSNNPFGNNPFGNNPFAPNPYAPAAAFFPNNMRPTSPFQPAMPSNTLVQKPAVAANQASPQPALEQLTKLIPETIAKPEVVAPPVAPAAVASPETPIEHTSAPILAQPQAEPPVPEAAPTESAAVVPAPELAQSTPDSAVAPLSEALPPTPATPAVAATHAAAPASAEAAASKSAAQATQPAATAQVTPEPTQAAAVPAEVAHAEPAASAPALPVTVPVVTASQPTETSLASNVTQKIEDALAHFDFDSAELTAAGRAMLDAWIKQASGDAPILVTGHADRLGPEPYNEKLSLLRAEAVKKYLAEKGKTAKRIVILGKGEKVPLINCVGDATPETKSCLAPNRRAEITLKPVVKRAAKVASKPAKTHTGR